MSEGIAIRPSQFILTYGVGSIIEAPGGPRVIPAFNKWGNMLKIKLNNPEYIIHEYNAGKLLGNAKIFKIPTNSSFENISDSKPIFNTIRFPMWAVCVIHGKLYMLDSHDGTRCPECIKTSSLNKKDSARDEAIRFVRACPNGHMDDVKWDHIVHQGSACENKIFEWGGGHSTLETVKIGCLECKAEISLKDVYNQSFGCSGYFPELEEYDNDCNQDMKIMLRSQSSLRIPKLFTVITIPPYDSNAFFHLSDPNIRGTIVSEDLKEWTRPKLIEKIRRISKNAPELISIDRIEAIEECSENELMDAVSMLYSKDEQETTMDSIMELEFKALKEGARHGAPPISSSGKTQFEINANNIKKIKITAGTLRVTPIQRLRSVIVQQGYMRTSTEAPAKIVNTYMKDGNISWYPGIELLGEGLFLDFENDEIVELGTAGEKWQKKFDKDLANNKKFHPMFVWWHTLAHAIINMLSIDSGYSSASIRERVYFDCDDDGKNPRGGLLLYTSQPSGDGTLGGLLAVASEFQNWIGHIRARMWSCSNDPLCASGDPSQNRNNGAACYACLMLSETSCENSNSMLDRKLVEGTI